MTFLADALAVGAGLFVVLGLAMVGRAVVGPTIYDRAIAINAVGTVGVVVVALAGAAFDDPGYLDVALVYALLNFLLSIGLAKVLAGGGIRR